MMYRFGTTYEEHTFELLKRALKICEERITERRAAKASVTAVKGSRQSVKLAAMRQLMHAEGLELRALRRVERAAGSYVYAKTKEDR